jgi:hypothetical protein
MIDTLHPHGLLIAAPDLVVGTPHLLDMVPTYSEDAGFDEATLKYLLRSAEHLTPLAAMQAHFPPGTPIAGHNLWVRKSVPRERAPGLYEFDVTARGRIGGLRYVTKVDAVTQQATQPNVELTTPSGYPFTYPTSPITLRANESALTYKVRYVDLTAPNYQRVSNTATDTYLPPEPAGYPARPAGPANQWVGIANPAYIYPAGWVLESRAADSIRLANGTEVAWAIEDTWVYHHPIRPNG